MDIRAIQARVGASVDGVLGPKTYAALFDKAAGRNLGAVGDALGRAAYVRFPQYQITSALRLAHWLAQGGHETTGFLYFKELGGPSYLSRYEGRRDLGNTQPGDGVRFCGRGIFQLTGRDNYADMGPRIGIDLIAHPERAADPETSLLIACLYWQGKGLSTLADRDDVVGITRKINGGLNGLDDRKARLARLKGVLL